MVTYSAALLVSLQFCVILGLGQDSGDLTVTLAVFSGRPDPTWPVTKSNGNYKRITTLLNKKGGLVDCFDAMPARLGYRGFLVKEGKNDYLVVGRKSTELQQLLLTTIPKGLLKGGDIREIQKMISSGAVKDNVGPLKHKRYAPTFNPVPWQLPDKRGQYCNRCYNYANEKRTDNVAEPGIGSGRKFERCDGPTIQAAAVRDGLIALDPQPPPNVPPVAPAGNRHLVALVVKEEGPDLSGDFHWFRLDDDGFWSHKLGQKKPTRLDNAGQTITDPRRAIITPHYRFISFMTSDRNTVRINGNENCNRILRQLDGGGKCSIV